MKSRFLLPLLCLALVFTALPAGAQCGDLIFRVDQGNYQQTFFGGQAIVLQPNTKGNMRVYLRSNGANPDTLAAEYGHPSQFGYRGMDPVQVRQVIRLDAQGPNRISRGNVFFTSGRPGTVTIGYRIVGSNHPQVFRDIPQACRAGVLTIQVQGGGGASAPGGQYAPNPTPNRGAWVAGRYQSDFGTVQLQQNGNQVQGSYAHQNGRLQGTLEGNVLRGTWSQAPSYTAPNDAGNVELTFSNGQFTGWWRYGYQGPWEGRWNGQASR
jgi:hypothetical protein